jgi:hypothetical protein
MISFQQIKDQAEKNPDPDTLRLLTDQLSSLIAQTDHPVEMLRLRASFCVKLDEKGKAINDYREILAFLPGDQHSQMQIEFLKTILRYNNTDIYANPNTNMDPWLE